MMPRILFFIFFSAVLHTATAQSWRIYYDSTELYWGGDWEKCIDLLEKALPLAEQESGKNHPNYVVLLNDLGLCYNYTRELEKAEELYKETLLLKKEVLGEDDLDYAATLLNLALIYQEQNKTEEAEKLYQDILRNYQVNYGDKHPEYASIQNYLGLLYNESGDYAKAEAAYKKALHIYSISYGKESSYYATALKNLGNLQKAMGNFALAKEFVSEATAIYEKVYGSGHPEVAQSISELAILLEQMGEYGEAEKFFLKAIAIQASYSGAEKIKYASTLNNLAGLYVKTGNLEKAKINFEASLPIYDSLLGQGHIDYATALNNYANYFIAVNNLEQAGLYYNQASEIYRKAVGELHPLYASSLMNLASLYRKTGRYAESEQFYLKALEIDKQLLGEKHPSYAISLNNLGILYMAMGDTEKAIQLYTQALDLKKETLGEKHPTYATSLNNLAVLFLAKKNYENAEPLLIEAINNQLQQVKTFFPYMSEKEKEAFYSTIRADVERFNSIALHRHKKNPSLLGEMYNHQLATKALLFRASDKMREAIQNSSEVQLISTFNLWRKEKEQLGMYYQISKDELESQNIDLMVLEEKVNRLEKELSAKSALFAKENGQQVYSWKDIQQKLKPGEAAIEMIRFRKFDIARNLSAAKDSLASDTSISYGFTDQIYYAALIITAETRDFPELVYMDNGQDLENKYISYYKNSIKYKLEDQLSFPMFWEGISAKTEGIKKIYFSPDGVYNKISLGMLLNPVTKTYLLNEQDICRLTSTKDLMFDNKAGRNTNQIVMLGDPVFYLKSDDNELLASNATRQMQDTFGLNYDKTEADFVVASLPGTRLEVESINKILDANGYDTELKMGAEATEKAIKEIKSPKILHVATHGFFSNELFVRENSVSAENPLFQSGLLLAGAENSISSPVNPNLEENTEDGILTAYEAMNLSLDNTDLVVLSACETGLGDSENGEGVYGLQRAFQVAGAKSIIISLWKVDDLATTELMTLFYKMWIQTGNKRNAFLSAQAQLRQKYPHPYYWGGFVMVGQ